jgi:hypothetical protein
MSAIKLGLKDISENEHYIKILGKDCQLSAECWNSNGTKENPKKKFYRIIIESFPKGKFEEICKFIAEKQGTKNIDQIIAYFKKLGYIPIEEHRVIVWSELRYII